MFFYMSGTPRNDVLQIQENGLCSHRLFSLHGDYQRAVHRWLDDVITRPEHPYPKFIMLDSGAFTAWNAGGEVTVSEVFDSYSRFEDKAGDLFDEIWMVNLDKIPGTRGVDPTPTEIDEALHISDENYARLVDRFGDRILPVYHQGEHIDRALELAEIAKYICISPRNDLPEGRRTEWSLQTHASLRKVYPDVMTHGLATTGNQMLRDVSWTSVDSAAWVLHAGFGKVDIFQEHKVHGWCYRNYFMSDDERKAGLTDQHIGATRGEHGEVVVHDLDYSQGKGEGLLLGGMSPAQRKKLFSVFASYGFDKDELVTNSRARAIVCMGELAKFCAWASEQQKNKPIQKNLY